MNKEGIVRKLMSGELPKEQVACAKCAGTDNGENWDETQQYWYCDDCITGYIDHLENGEWSKK